MTTEVPLRAVVIGGSRGLGAHLATRLLANGWEVTAVGRTPVERTELDERVAYLQADLADDSSHTKIVSLLRGVSPRLIVNNAVAYPRGERLKPAVSEIETVFRVNAIAPFRILLEYLTELAPEVSCSCVVVNSDAIYNANETSGVYAASKAALRVLTTVLAATCRSSAASVSTLVLGPLNDPRKIAELDRIAELKGATRTDVMRAFLRRSNPSYVTDALLDFESCFLTVETVVRLGRSAHGMVCRLDGGSSGSLV